MKKSLVILALLLFINNMFLAQSTTLSDVIPIPQDDSDRPIRTWIKNYNIVESFPFVYDGQKYSMQYMTLKNKNTEVNAVFFVPDGYDPYDYKNHKPPMFNKLIYHNLGKVEDNFVGVWTDEVVMIEGKKSTIYKEIRLPDDIAGMLVEMLSGEYKMSPNKFLKDNCIEEVFDSKLLETKIRIGFF